MDSRGALLAALAALLAACGEGRLGASAPELNELRWLDPAADPVAALTASPPSCVARPDAPKAAAAVRLGEIAFRSPALLGGNAARVGLSCESCHRNGRSNKSFFFDGVSGAPGTADVTSGFFAAEREDNTFNPEPIVDLAKSGGRLAKYRRDGRQMRGFVQDLIEIEFSGAPASDTVVEAVAAYLTAISPDACGDAPEPLDWRRDIADAVDAVGFARDAAAAGDGATADLMIESARAALGRLHERYPTKTVRDALAAASRDLRAAGRDPERLEAWIARTPSLRARLGLMANSSLFAPDAVQTAFND